MRPDNYRPKSVRVNGLSRVMVSALAGLWESVRGNLLEVMNTETE